MGTFILSSTPSSHLSSAPLCGRTEAGMDEGASFNADPRKIGSNPFLDLSHRLFPSFPDLPNGNDGKDLGEDHVEKNKKGDATCKDGPFHPCGMINDHLIGSLGLVSVGTTITKRSSHIPITMEIEAIKVPRGVRVFFKLRMGKGITKQKRNIPQKWGRIPL